MTQKDRRIIFYFLVMVFILAGGLAVFYSNGWRFDPATLNINQVGAIFLQVTPPDADLTIEKSRFKFKSGLLRSGTLIANLFPKKYLVKVSKNGYQGWSKEVEVKPSLVTEVPPIILLPEKFSLGQPIASDLSDFWIGPNEKMIFLKSGALYFNKQKLAGQIVYGWQPDGTTVITKNENQEYFLIDLNKPTSGFNINLGFNNLRASLKDYSAIAKIDFNPLSKNELIIATSKGLYTIDFKNTKFKTVFQGETRDFIANEDELLFLAGSQLWIYNLSLNSKESLSQKILGGNQPLTDFSTLKSAPDGHYLALIDENGELLFLNRQSLAFLTIKPSASAVTFSPDSKKAAWLSDKNELGIYNLAENDDGADKNNPLSISLGSIDKNALAWHKNSGYLLIKYPTDLYLLDANSAFPINMQVIEKGVSKFQYNQSEDTIYLLKNNRLYKLPLS